MIFWGDLFFMFERVVTCVGIKCYSVIISRTKLFGRDSFLASH